MTSETRLTWLDLSRMPKGLRVVFTDPHDIFPECVVPAGATGAIQENGLNEIWGGLIVVPDNQSIRDKLAAWSGEIHLGWHLDASADTDANATAAAQEWHALSPLSPLMMTQEEAKTLKVGDKVRLLCCTRGEVDGEGECEVPPGEIVTVSGIGDSFAAPPGWAVAIRTDGGIINSFDGFDFGGLYPFALIPTAG